MAQGPPPVPAPEIGDCIFCHLDREIIAETRLSLAVFDSFPVSKGHALVLPRRHVVTIWDMTDEEYADAFALARKVKDVLQGRFGAAAFNVGVNCGEVAGQSVWHAHIHVIPRYPGDIPNPKGGVRNILPAKGQY
jgi:diadenosine tetraphosphate (Ap4A) HIT family hydrolase